MIKLNPAQSERVDLMIEECSEVIQILTKIKRFGFDSFNPNDPEKTSNRELLSREISDFMIVSSLMAVSDGIPLDNAESYISEKLERLSVYTEHQHQALDILRTDFLGD